MRFLLMCNLAFLSLFILSCQNEQETGPVVYPNKKIYGVWRYDDKPKSRIEIQGNNYYENLVEMNSTITGEMVWRDDMHYTLIIKKLTGPIKQVAKPGDKFDVRIAELNESRFRFRVVNMDVQPIIELTKVEEDNENK